jgi:CheY-like chemotaxis protein/anti-sigma regulatory factor (Ser/Thr protein kinase)
MDLKLDLGSVSPVSGRPSALTEVLTNLMLNAIDAMPEGGTLAVGTRQQDADVVITVTDTGIGMAEEVRRRIFEPFFSTKGESGSGLGLAMSYSIVKRHSGEITVDSEPGRGATFTLVFPAASQAAAAPPTASAPRPRRAARVMVVDDERQVLATLAELLRTQGHQVTAAPGGRDAVELFRPGGFDVVLTNIGMAGMNGWEVAERIRAIDRTVPLVFITGWGLREEDNARLASLGITRCLFKPVRPAELDAAIQATLGA